MKTVNKIYSPVFFGLMAFFMSACGGGGGSDSPTVGSGTTPIVEEEPEEMEVTVPTFTELTASAGIVFESGYSLDIPFDPRFFAGGAASGDIDNDGDIDVFITRGNLAPNLLYINNGDGFTEQAEAAGLVFTPTDNGFPKLSGPCFADMDGDSDLDLFVGGINGDPSFVFANNGDGTFVDVTQGSGLDNMTSTFTVSCAFGDYDRDGYIDLALSHWGTSRPADNPGDTETLWRNISSEGRIQFESVSVSAGIASEIELELFGVLGFDHDYTFSPNFADINDDGWPDLLSVSDFVGSLVFLNNQDGTFTNITDRAQITDQNGMGTAVGDYDNDGDLDWFVSSINGNRLYNNTAGTFTVLSDAAGTAIGAWGWGSCFEDFNGDGHLDIYQTNGWVDEGSVGQSDEPFSEDITRLWMSDREGAFEDRAIEAGVNDTDQGRGVICADFDGDHDVDILQLISTSEQGARLLQNNLRDVTNITIELVGQAPNTQALGSRIFVEVNGVTQMREVSIGSNFTSHNPNLEIFGLGQAEQADEIRVVWPDGSESVAANVSGNQRLTLTQP